MRKFFQTEQAHRIYNCSEIHHNRKELALLDKCLFHAHLTVSNCKAKHLILEHAEADGFKYRMSKEEI